MAKTKALISCAVSVSVSLFSHMQIVGFLICVLSGLNCFNQLKVESSMASLVESSMASLKCLAQEHNQQRLLRHVSNRGCHSLVLQGVALYC